MIMIIPVRATTRISPSLMSAASAREWQTRHTPTTASPRPEEHASPCNTVLTAAISESLEVALLRDR